MGLGLHAVIGGTGKLGSYDVDLYFGLVVEGGACSSLHLGPLHTAPFMILICALFPVYTRQNATPSETSYFTSRFVVRHNSFTITLVISYAVYASSRLTYDLCYIGVNAGRRGLPAMFHFLPLSRLLRFFTIMPTTNVFRSIHDSCRRNVFQRILQPYMLVGVSGIVGHATSNVWRYHTSTGHMVAIDRQSSVLCVCAIIRSFTRVIGRRH